MWILILTLTTGFGVSVESAYLESESACYTAGELWAKQNDDFFHDSNFICVKDGEQ